MAYEQSGSSKVDISFKAAADLRTHQYKFVKLDGSGNVVLCSAAGERPLGVLQNKPNTGENAVVRVLGLTKAIASAAITTPNQIATDASGLVKVASRLVQASGNASNVAGLAVRAAGGASEVMTIYVTPGGIWPTADA
jgi:hypothetical protein